MLSLYETGGIGTLSINGSAAEPSFARMREKPGSRGGVQGGRHENPSALRCNQMTYEVAVENGKDGYVATVMGWPSCIATAPTREQVLARLREDLSKRLADVEIVSLDFKELDVDAPQGTHPMLKFAGVFKDDPLFDEVAEEIEAYRREIDADEGAA